MEIQLETVGKKVKHVFTKRGRKYTRKGYDITVKTAESFTRKCSLLGESETRIVEKLVEAFISCNGWGHNCKQAPFLEPKSELHVKEAAERVTNDLFPWANNN